MGVVNFIDQNELKGVFKNKKESLKYFNYDLTLFQEGAEAIKYDKNIFNCEYMCNYYGEQKIDIRIQNPCDFGFYPYKMKNKPFSMLLKDYRYYQKHYNNKEMMEKFVHIEHLKKGQVFFGVNFEPSNNQLN